MFVLPGARVIARIIYGTPPGGPFIDRRRALELLASCRDGCTEAILLARGFAVDQIELVRAGLATAHTPCVIVGRRAVDIAHVKITEAGRRALTDKSTQ